MVLLSRAVVYDCPVRPSSDNSWEARPQVQPLAVLLACQVKQALPLVLFERAKLRDLVPDLCIEADQAGRLSSQSFPQAVNLSLILDNFELRDWRFGP